MKKILFLFSAAVLALLAAVQPALAYCWEVRIHVSNAGGFPVNIKVENVGPEWNYSLYMVDFPTINYTSSANPIDLYLSHDGANPDCPVVYRIGDGKYKVTITNQVYGEQFVVYFDYTSINPSYPIGFDFDFQYDTETTIMRGGLVNAGVRQLSQNQVLQLWTENGLSQITAPFQPMDATNLQVTTYNNHPKLTWRRAGPGPSTKYRVYSATYKLGPYYNISGTLTDSSWVDYGRTVGGTSKVYYKIRAVSGDGTKESVNFSNLGEIYASGWAAKSSSSTAELPQQYQLGDNTPNPFNPSTTISYSLPEPTHVRISVFDMLGREVALLVDEMQESGYKSVTFDAAGLTSGIYYYRMQAGNFAETKKMLLMK